MSIIMLSKFLLVSIILVHIFILTKLIYFPYPELFIYPYLTNHGLKPYAQILDQHFPGPMFLPINLDNLGMNTPEIARVWSIAIVVTVQIMLFLISKNIFVNVLYLIWQPFFEGWVLWIDSFLPLLLLPAFYFFCRNKFFTTGIFLGLAIVFKQTIIPLSFFTLIFIFWKTRGLGNCLRFLSGVLIPVGFMTSYLASIGVLRDFWYWAVVFNLTIFAKYGRGMGPTSAHLLRAAFVFGLPFLLIGKIKELKIQVLLIFLAGALLGLSTRFDFVHLQPALPFAILITAILLRKIGLRIVYLLIAFWWLITFYKGHLGDRVIAFDQDTYKIAEKIKTLVSPGEKIFVFGGEPQLYQMSATLPAGDIFVFQFPWFMQLAEGRILEGIKQDKPRIVISDRTVTIEKQKLTDFAPNIDMYIRENYQKIESIGTTDILERR